MSYWPSKKGREVFAALIRVGWVHERTAGSHRVLTREGSGEYVFAFGDSDEIGPVMMARIASRTGLKLEDLR